MRQLAGGDDVWFAIDTETTPMHLLIASVYDPATSDAGTVDLDGVKSFLEERLGGLPLRKKLVTVPFHADFPYWVEDEHFDIDRHLRHVELDPPGDWSTLRATLQEIAEIPLDRSRPLWEMVLITGLGRIDGLPDGCFALAQKIHHGQFDGTNLVRLSSRIHTLAPTAEPPRPDRWEPERTPSDFELLVRSPWNRAQRMLSGARVLWDAVPRVVEALSPKSEAGSGDPDELHVPPTHFAEPIGTRRPIVRIEVVRIRPRATPHESLDVLIEDPWQVLQCDGDVSGCVVEFEDPEFAFAQRDTVYYVRAIEAPSPTINAGGLRCETDGSGACVEPRPCRGVPDDDDCLVDAEPRAWSSPIFVDWAAR